MIALEYIPRTIVSKDWATIIFIITFSIIAINKLFFDIRFVDFTRLGVSDRYLKVYVEEVSKSPFAISMFLVMLVSFSFFMQLILTYYNITILTDFVIFIRIFTALFVFILAKYFIEKIVAITFEIEPIIDEINFAKLNYRAYFGLLILPFVFVSFYNDWVNEYIIFGSIAIILILNVLIYFFSIRKYQNLFFSKFFYFILYLCTLEIAPYYFLYVWIIK
jgi:hypothetical protein